MSLKDGRPRDRASWDQRYVDGELPWDSGQVDAHLCEVVVAYRPEGGRALEIGCGTATNTIWLAKRGFAVTALDLSPTAIEKAEAKVGAAGVTCELLTADFLKDPIPGGPFDFIYDRGCFHVFDEAQQRARFAEKAAELIAPKGIWHSLIGSTDGPPRDSGPPRHSATVVMTAIERYFEVLELRAVAFDAGPHKEAKAWQLVARRRETYAAE